ncbi:uncharacterized protein N7469_010192 [Penicillium citrinum]|uniref:Uncharacterized protein n=1 Tax=Penicillium citrinum TaxID=5077 RepID=A0A9W9NJT2_PENCI|nr:uncharacterized protein N7469_010192 [Penicillium citrinum]KAJ5221305.1 hypothetical protein N7469_010192 [Penicillium citrinum]
MKHSRKTGILPEDNNNHFRTPRKPSTAATHLLSRSTTSNTAPSPAISTPSTVRKGNPLPPIRAQSTLTQIDFIPQPTNVDNDQWDYLAEEHHDGAQNRQKSAHLDDGSESETDYRPPLRTRANSSRFETNNDHPKRRRKSNMTPIRTVGQGQSLQSGQTPKASGAGRGKRKSTEKQSAKRDKTLTQMDFVRRYIPIEDSDDNDVNMAYIQPSPQLPIEKDEAREQDASATITKAVKFEPTVSSKRNRRMLEHEIDLSTGETITSGESQNTNMLNTQKYAPPSKPPLTPQKYRKLEIPSSQSPESPGLTSITSSQFNAATRSPLKRIPLNFGLQEDIVKQESPPASLMAGDSQYHENASQARSPTRLSLFQEENAQQEQSISADVAKKVNSHVEESDYMERLPEDKGWKPHRSQRERTVVYETDAESSASEFDPAENESLNPTNEEILRERVSHLVDDGSGLPSDDSQEPPLPETQPPEDLGFDPPSEPPMSDASAYYQRVQPATQFPLEPVPALNTQKLHELFPNDDNTQSPQHKPVPAHSYQKFQGPFLQSQTQGQRENPEQDHTEVVPESSPMREQQDHMDEADGSVFQRPPAPGSVVQVESSQPVHRGDSGPGNILSRSQLLTSSVMESIALPNFWTASQDSVGEPYSLPEH